MAHAYLGVDGGQSSTMALIGDGEGRVVGIGRAGPCNHVKGPGGREKFIAALSESVAAARQQAGLESSNLSFAAACLGFSGGPADKEQLARGIVPADHLQVTTDAAIALEGATGGAPGIIVIAGTGSIAFGRNAEGRTARAGGWGFILGDEGGAFDIVRQALRAALRWEEGWGPRTALHARLMETSGAATANDLMHWCYTEEFPRSRVAAWAALVDQAAREGDAIAAEILRGAGQQLATLASAVRSQIFESGSPARIAYTGGVFRSEIVRQRFQTFLELGDGNQVVPPQFGPAAGALLAAYALAGRRVALNNVPETEKLHTDN